MRFQVPQFIERESKILGPLTFKQFIFVGIAGTIIFILYFSLAKTNFFLFVLTASVLVLGALALAFFRVGGRSLPEVLANFLVFFASSKIYLWKHKAVPPKLIKLGKRPKEEKKEEEPVLKIKGKGKLEKLATKIETGAQ